MINPLIPMTCITGHPNRDKICTYLNKLKSVGIVQLLLYPRSGCEIEYLSESWFDVISIFIDYCSSNNMKIWLYDDYNWPSGDANSKVTKKEEFRLKSIYTSGDKIGTINYKSLHNSGIFGGKYFPDLLNEKAVDYFIKCTHEEYYKRFKKYFGNVIIGMYTDEPSIGYCCTENSIPYYNGIENDYLHLCGRNFINDLQNNYSEFLYNAVTVISDKFKSSYINKIKSWCESHNILMTGHLLSDSEVYNSIVHSGRFLKNLSEFSLPGIDEIYTDFTDENEFSLFNSIEYSSGKNGAMAELFALGPCDMTYAKKRAMIYFSACHKVDHYFLAVSHMDLRGNLLVKDYFSDFSSDQPDFEGLKLLSDDACKASYIAKKDYQADVYVRYPYEFGAKNLNKTCDKQPFLKLINYLSNNNIQWKYLDDELRTDAPIIEMDEKYNFFIDKKPLNIDNIHKKIIIEDSEKNRINKGIFVRTFKDNSLVIINLFAKEGLYYINGKQIYLKQYDVKFDLLMKSI